MRIGVNVPKHAATLGAGGGGPRLLDPFSGDPRETHHPEAAWQALATVAADGDLGASPTRLPT